MEVVELKCQRGKILWCDKSIYDYWKQYKPDLIVSVGYFLPIVNTDMVCRIPQIILEIEKEEDFPEHMAEIAKALEQIHNALRKNKIVVVHCQDGRKLSSALLVRYMMKYCQLSNSQAISYLESKKDIGNSDFLRFLK